MKILISRMSSSYHIAGAYENLEYWLSTDPNDLFITACHLSTITLVNFQHPDVICEGGATMARYVTVRRQPAIPDAVTICELEVYEGKSGVNWKCMKVNLV